MRLVIDLQAAQGCNKDRGIGRYALALAEALLAQASGNDVWLALNDAFPDTIEPLRAAFDSLLPQDRIVVWKAPGRVAGIMPANDWRRQCGEILRESFLASLEPDLIHVPSLFEGFIDDAVTSVGHVTEGRRTSVTIHDLIPLAHRERYLADPAIDAAYQRKILGVRRAGLWLAVSEWSRREAIERLDLPAEKVVVVPNAAASRFRPRRYGETDAEAVRQRYGLAREFVMYTGGMEWRKNVEGLIGAYARLPLAIRAGCQLAIVCSADPKEEVALRQRAAQIGLAPHELVLTGFVPDEDLVALYNLCAVFCFPSLHEGFGLPALEAMQCGAPTIGARSSSIPEVIGRADALFDPRDEDDMAGKLHQVLTDAAYRQSLAEHGLQQAKEYSWQESAARAWAAFEAHHAEMPPRGGRAQAEAGGKRPRLAYISPLPPERSGISDYSAELLPELVRHYDIDVIVSRPPVAEPWIAANCAVRDVGWFDRNAHLYDRILYHFGNSEFHRHMFDLIRRHPGIVMLHDFYLSGIIAHMDLHDGRTGYWARALYRSHGYHAVQERYRAADPADIIWKYPANLEVLQHALGIIVHSEFSRRLATQYYGEGFAENWAIVPHLRRLPRDGSRSEARRILGFSEHDFVVCAFGVMGPAKLNHRLLQAWLQSSLAQAPECHLVFVGEDPPKPYADQLRSLLDHSPAPAVRIRMTGFASGERYRQYLAAADAAVQLRTRSRGESSGTVLDCMAYSLPTIVNAHGSLADLPRQSLVMLPDRFTDQELFSAIEELRADPEARKRLGASAHLYVKDHHSPRQAADQYWQAIEQFATRGREAVKARAFAALAAFDPAHGDERDWVVAARAMCRDLPWRQPRRQIFVDISELVQRDVGTGIQRVVRNILGELIAHPPSGYRVEPVYATVERSGYRYARAFALQFLGCAQDSLQDEAIIFQHGDVFLGVDLQPHIVPRQAERFAEMRRAGVEIHFVVHDLLPILMPQFFAEGAAEVHARWLSTVAAYADGIICVSRTVAEQVIQWLNETGPRRLRPLRIGWAHPGADIEKTRPTSGLPQRAGEILAALNARPSFLMVGTIEPRKGHAQVLAAFERLWAGGSAQGSDVNLVIVGKRGWMVETFTNGLRAHPEWGRRLFWLEGISDEYLERLYSSCACLLAASEGEGFGLPLIEAARHGLPILARDIPVFREVAGEHAHYFRAATPEALMSEIQDWLALFAAGAHERSEHLPWLTWAESSERLKALLLGRGWHARWPAAAMNENRPCETMQI
jgi:glycosyltransferase involved in cell wall biosynthesis